MKTALAFIAVAALATGCTTIAEHPRTASAIGIVIGTSIALSVNGKHHSEPQVGLVKTPGLPCYPQPNGSCR